jgi:cation-transporting ATPase E
LLALAVGFARWPYPFLPRHLTIVSTLTIGVPAFFLALAPNLRRYQPGFITRVLKFAIPCGFVAAAATFSSYAVARNIDAVTLDESRTTATLVLLVVGLWVLNILARPITPFRGALFGSMVGIFLLILALPSAREFYALQIPPQAALVSGLLIAGVAVALLELAWSISQHHLPRAQRTRRLAWRNPAATRAARGPTTSPDA